MIIRWDSWFPELSLTDMFTLNISFEEKCNPLGLFITNYTYYAKEYYTFVTDVLNHDYFSLVGLNPNLTLNQSTANGISSGLFSQTGRKKIEKKKIIGAARHRDYIDIVKYELQNIDISAYISIVEKIYINDEFPTLSAAQKLVAFLNTHNPFGSSMPTYNIETVLHASYSTGNNNDATLAIISNCETDTLVIGEIPDPENDYWAICTQLQSDIGNTNLAERMDFFSLSDTFTYFFFKLINENISIKKCKHCGCYFVPDHSNARYCSKPSPENPKKSCQEYATYVNYQNRSCNEANKLYRQIYNNLLNKVKRTQSSILQKRLDNFILESSNWKSKIKTGEKTEIDYTAWLQETKQKNQKGGAPNAPKINP